MSVQKARYPSAEAPPFGPSTRFIMNLEVPSNAGFTDTKNSSLVFQTSLPVTDTSTGSLLILPATFASYMDASGIVTPAGPEVMIRNSRSWSTNLPQTEQIQQNIFRSTLDWYTKSRAQESCEAILGNGTSHNYGTIAQSGLPNTPDIAYVRPVAFNTPVTTPSQKISAEYNIPLKHADSMGEFMTQFPNIAVGDKYYRLELEQQYPVVTPCVMPKEMAILNMSAIATQVGNAANPLVLGISSTIARTFPTVETFDNIPLYVSAPVRMSMDDSGGAVHWDTKVASLDVSSSTGKLSIIIDPPYTATGATAALTDIELNYLGDEYPGTAYAAPVVLGTNPRLSCTFEIINAYVQPLQLQLTPEQFARAQEALKDLTLQFYEYKVFTRNMLEGDTYNDTVPIPVGASDVAIMTPTAGQLVSTTDEAVQYRLTVDGKQTTDRAIFVGPEGNVAGATCRQLHNDRISKYFLNGGQALRKFDCPNTSYAEYEDTGDHFFVPQILMPGVSNLTVELDADGETMGQKTTYFVFRIPRALKFKDGKPTLL